MPPYPEQKPEQFMEYLPNNCECSKLIVSPKNWHTAAASTKKEWFIFYRFRDPVYASQYPQGKQCKVRGMNDEKTLAHRQRATRYLLKKEIESLQQGYNPIAGVYIAEQQFITGDLTPGTSFAKALDMAFDMLTCAQGTKNEIKSVKKYVLQALAPLGLSTMPVGEVRKRHIKKILEHLAKNKPVGARKKIAWSDNIHNKYRSYLMMLFTQIEDYEAIDINPMTAIKKKDVVKRIREVLTDQQLDMVSNHIREADPGFYIFLGCFYPSGSREVELLGVKGRQVNLKERYFIRLIKKGGQLKEVPTIITAGALPYWTEALQGCGPEDYVFSRGLKPGPTRIGYDRIGKRWRELVKSAPPEGLGLTADCYSLKHLFATKSISKTMDDLRQARELAAKHAGHTTTDMMKEVYDVNKKRLDKELLNNEVGF